MKAAVAAYRAALEVRIRERTPLDWAITQTNLGKSLSALGYWTEDVDVLKQAVATHRAVLEVRNREQVPLDWATTQTNVGNALLALGKGCGGLKYLARISQTHLGGVSSGADEPGCGSICVALRQSGPGLIV